MTHYAFECEGVEKRFPHFHLNDVHLHLEHGQIMGFIGPNGAGKTTTIRILMGLMHPDGGKVRVLGHPIPQAHVAAKWDIGFVSEDMRLYGKATLGWHMRFIQRIYPNWDAAYASDLLRRFDLMASQTLKGFSHGQRVKAKLLLVLARRPRLLLLDEPTTGLDPVARYDVLGEMMEVLRDDDRTILFSSHNTADVAQLSDQIAFIDGGRIIASKEKDRFLDDWRRIQVQVGPDNPLPTLPGEVETRRAGQIATIITNRYQDGVANLYRDAGATVLKIEPMNLEEIFLTSVLSCRKGRVA